MNEGIRRLGGCEVCGNVNLAEVLDLGLHPMCDDLVPIGEGRVCRRYPITILFCDRCCTAHQRFQIPKRELFPTTYHYRSRFTADVLLGMADLVESCEQKMGSIAGKIVLDIGCNDGSLLDRFRSRGAKTIGVEPTDALQDAVGKGHVGFSGFLSEDIADAIVASHGYPDVITFTNVFAHIENLSEVLGALRRLSAPTTVVVIENHYLGSVLEGNQFDTFYHEHPRTYSYTSFVHIAQSLGVRLAAVEFPRRYGGNIRVFLGALASHASQKIDDALVGREMGFRERFAVLRARMEHWRSTKKAFLNNHIRIHGRMPAKAFPGRAAILVRLLELDEDSISSVYEKPGSLKIGHYLPGTRIPIRSDDDLFAFTDKATPILNLAWHIPVEIRHYLSSHGYSGPVIDVLHPNDFDLAH